MLAFFWSNNGTLRHQGWRFVSVKTMNDIYDHVIDADDKKRCAPAARARQTITRHDRIERIELFDEIEEWRLIQNHYCIALAKSADDVLPSLKL